MSGNKDDRMDKKVIKCKVVDYNIEPCWALELTIEDHHRKKGISMMQFFNMKTSKPTRSVAMVKSGQRTKKGLALNYCPFCGENIIAHMEKPREEA